MKFKMNYLLGILLLASFVPGPVFAQQTKPGFVPLPNDIRCDVRGAMTYRRPDNSLSGGYIARLVCWMSDKNPQQEKEISLVRLGGPSAAAQFLGDMLMTEQFGDLQLGSDTKVIAVAADKLQLFRDYLTAAPANPVK